MSDFPRKEKDHTNGPAVIVIGLAAVALLWASVIALQAYFRVSEGEVATARAAIGQGDSAASLKAAQLADLNQSKFADASKGTLKRLSMTNAKAAVLRDVKAGKSMIPLLGELNKPSLPALSGFPVVAPPKTETAKAPEGETPVTEAALPASGKEEIPVKDALAPTDTKSAAPQE